MAKRECRIQGCATQHDRSLFCCRAHWFELPKHLRDAIWATYRSARGVLSVEYMQAAENAEAYLEHRDARDMREVLA